MTNKNLTDITIILDRSGSMNRVKGATIEGLNRFITEQKAVEGEAYVTLVQFDHEIETVYTAKSLGYVPLLTHETYQPRGSTALLDAIGQAINAAGARFAAMREDQRPGRVIMVVLTDGQENCSREFSKARIKELIKHQTDKYSWTFVFLGANIDAATEASSLGIHTSNAIQYGSSQEGVGAAWKGITKGIRSYRLCANPEEATENFRSLVGQESLDEIQNTVDKK